MNHSERLTSTIAAVCPIHGISGGTPATVRLQYTDAATAEQRAAAEAALAAFDWSTEAQAAWERDKRRAAAIEMLNSKEPAMVALRAFAALVISRLQTVMSGLGIPVTSLTDLEAAWVDVIASGAVDEGMPTRRN